MSVHARARARACTRTMRTACGRTHVGARADARAHSVHAFGVHGLLDRLLVDYENNNKVVMRLDVSIANSY